MALVDLKEIDLQLIVIELILGNNCSSRSLPLSLSLSVSFSVCVCVCVCVRCISAEFSSNREHEFYIMVVCLSVHDFAFSLPLAKAAVLVYSDVSSLQLETCLLARFCVYFNLCDVQK